MVETSSQARSLPEIAAQLYHCDPAVDSRDLAQHADYVVGGNYAGQLILVIDHGEGLQVVLVEKLSDFILFYPLVSKHQGLLREGTHGSVRRSKHDARERNRADQGSIGVDQING